MQSRRTLIAAGLAAAAAGRSLAMSPPARPPLLIAHRGASGERPEETRLAYELAIEEGADFIEPDLVPTRDGWLVCRHEPEIGATTDVAARPEFADRRTTLVIDGEPVDGWFTHHFTLAELKTLRCRERLPRLRPGSARFDGQAEILTYQEVIDLARAGSRRTGRTIGTYPEMKHPSFFASLGLPLEHRLADILKTNGLTGPEAPVFVQCFEVGALETFAQLSGVRRVLLIDRKGGPADRPGVTYAEMITPAGLKAVSAYAHAIGPNQALVLDLDAAPRPTPTRLVSDAHAAGLEVHSWTARRENQFLPTSLRTGSADGDAGNLEALLDALYAAGVDGVFSDFTRLNAAARGRYLNPSPLAGEG